MASIKIGGTGVGGAFFRDRDRMTALTSLSTIMSLLARPPGTER